MKDNGERGRGSRSQAAVGEQTRASAFTLIELLVVVSIIALLISILLPSMQRARKQARAVVCMTQMRQAGAGIVMYLNTYDTFPPHQFRMRDFEPDLEEDIRLRWFDLLALILSGHQLARPHHMPADEWEQFKRGNSCFAFTNCPATPTWDVGRNNSVGYNYKYLGSFRDNTDDANPHAPRERFPVKGLRNPGATVAFADSDGTGWTMPWGPEKPAGDHNPLRLGNHGYTLDPTYIPIWSVNTYSGGHLEPYASRNWRTYLSDRHLGRSTTIFADGHGEPVEPREAYQNNRMWNGLGLDPGLDEDHPLYAADRHVEYKIAPGSGQMWRYE